LVRGVGFYFHFEEVGSYFRVWAMHRDRDGDKSRVGLFPRVRVRVSSRVARSLSLELKLRVRVRDRDGLSLNRVRHRVRL
jgi:hypothetical protein